MMSAVKTYAPFVVVMLIALALDKRGMLSFLAPSAAAPSTPATTK